MPVPRSTRQQVVRGRLTRRADEEVHAGRRGGTGGDRERLRVEARRSRVVLASKPTPVLNDDAELGEVQRLRAVDRDQLLRVRAVADA